MAFADRKSSNNRGSSGSNRSSRDEAPARQSSFKKQSSGGSQGQQDWLNLGSITAVKKLLESNDDYADICDALKGSEFSFSLKIFTGDDDKTIVLRNGDYVTLKFKNGPKDPDFVLGKASLSLKD